MVGLPHTPANPVEALIGLASGLWVSRILWAAARLGIADAIDPEPTPLAAIAERTGTRVDDDVLPMLLAGVAGAAMRTSLHRWLASGFTAALPDLVDEAWNALAAGLPAPPG